MTNVEDMNPYPMKVPRASSTIALVLLGGVMIVEIITGRNNMDYSDDPVLKQIFLTLVNLGIAVVFSLEGRYLYLHRKWNIQQSIESKVMWQIVLCISLASLTWMTGIVWLVRPA